MSRTRQPKSTAIPLGRKRQKKAVGHTKRVKALAGSKVKAPETREAMPHAIRSQTNRIRGLRPGFDGTPNMPAKDAPESTPDIVDGPIVIDADLAGAQLRELAMLHTEVRQAQHRADEKAEIAKVAKKTVESKTALLLEKLRSFTHTPSLPLFDQAQAAADRQRLLEADAAARDADLLLAAARDPAELPLSTASDFGRAASETTEPEPDPEPEPQPEPEPDAVSV